MTRLQERKENFIKAFKLFERANKKYMECSDDDIYKLALIQSFEIVYEIGWKILKDILAEKDVEVFTPRDVIKTAFSMNILKNGQLWIDMAKDRNASSHEYNQEKVDIIIENISMTYYRELLRFKNSLEENYA